MVGDTSINLGRGREFDLIRGFLQARSRITSPNVLVGPGDDAAVVQGSPLVLSVDLSVEDVHFRREWLTPWEIGFRATSAALSDLAAMAARPIGVLVSLAVSESDAGAFATEVMDGVGEAARVSGADLIGGDLTRSPAPLIVDVAVIGETATPILRKGALPGDELWVSGRLGGAALGILLLSRGEPVPPEVFTTVARPQPRVLPAQWLVRRGLPKAMIDLSDGLGKDADHLAAASEVRVVIDAARVPLHPALVAGFAPHEAIRIGLSGGEDYELCFAARPGTVQPHVAAFEEEFRVGLERVGSVEAGAGVYVTFPGERPRAFVPEGFQHFGAAS